jgi:hypothetical protein
MRHGRHARRIHAVEHLHIQKNIVELGGKCFRRVFREFQARQSGHVRDFILSDFQWLQTPFQPHPRLAIALAKKILSRGEALFHRHRFI